MIKWLNVDEVAKYLRTTSSTIYKLKEAGKIRGYRAGRNLLFDPEEIDADIKSEGKKTPKRQTRVRSHANRRVVS